MGGGTNTNWNSSPTTNWADSSGGAGNQIAPTTGDSVFFDNGSGTGAAVWNTSISLLTLDCTGSRNLVAHNSSITITISSGNFVAPSGVGATFTPNVSSIVTFTATSGTQQLTSSGKTLGSIVQNGAGGTTQLQDNLTIGGNSSASLTLTAGTFAGQTFTVTTPSFSSSNANTRALTGSGAWTVGSLNAAGALWAMTTITGLTVSGFTSNISFTGTVSTARSVAVGNITLQGTVSVGANTSGGSFAFNTAAGTTFGGFNPAGPNYLTLTAGQTLVLTNAPTIAGSSGSTVAIKSNLDDTVATLSVASGTASFSWSTFRAITCTGGATFSATDSFDLGRNTGITIAVPGGPGSTITSAGVIGS